MDGSAFRSMDLSKLVSWPLLILAGIGLLAIGSGLCFGAFWALSHLRWVW